MPPKRKSAFFSATQEAQKETQQENTVKQWNSNTAVSTHSEPSEERQAEVTPSTLLHRETVKPFQGETAKPQESKAVKVAKKEVKVSFYLTPEQEQKLDDLAYEHKKHTGKRINRNDIVRHLIDHCSIENLYNIE